MANAAAPYRHARLSAVKPADDPNYPLRIKDDATADELREEIMRHIGFLVDGGIIDLEALPVPKASTANYPRRFFIRAVSISATPASRKCQLVPHRQCHGRRHHDLTRA
jgi:hypothetical protein